MANKAIKYRLYPTTEQATMFAKTFGCCRKVYSLMLNDKIESYKTTGKFVSVTPAMYKKDYPFLKEVDSLALANVQLNLQSAFKNCFDKKEKRKTDFLNLNPLNIVEKPILLITRMGLSLLLIILLNCLR